jgi:hypothetical protein
MFIRTIRICPLARMPEKVDGRSARWLLLRSLQPRIACIFFLNTTEVEQPGSIMSSLKKSNRRQPQPRNQEAGLPSSLMVWSITDRVIENPAVLQEQFDDLLRSGFGGVAAFVRCSRYTWHDEPARKALARISSLCRRHGMHCWLGPDPRFVSRSLINETEGLPLLLFGNRPRAEIFPHCTPITDGHFNIRCELTPRHVHMLQEVAIEYTPARLAGVYAIRAGATVLGARDVVDITLRARLFYNARDRYVEAFGSWQPDDDGQWNVTAFFLVHASHVDYADRRQLAKYASLLEELRHAGVSMDSLMWDEPGFTCTYGTLPFSHEIARSVQPLLGSPQNKQLWKLAFDSEDGTHIPLRVEYYRSVQQMVIRAQQHTNRVARRLWGSSMIASIHDTWHFESADMCDMNHGSLDLWEGTKAKTGGFVDLGDIQKLRDPESPWYAHLAAMSVICSSLGKTSKGGFSYNNLWTVGDDDNEGWQVTVMDHCVNVMAAFGTRWLAHAYGPVGTIGQEKSFLGSPPLPGYPEHSTWPRFPEWNRRLREHFSIAGNNLPWSNVLVVFPVETLYALADQRADAIASSVFQLLLTLLDAHYHVDVLSPSSLLSGRWRGEILEVQGQQYSAVIYPFASVVDPRVARLLSRRAERILYAFLLPERSTLNRRVLPGKAPYAEDTSGVLQWLERRSVPRPIDAPPSTWVTLTHVAGTSLICVVPSRHGIPYQGKVGFPSEASSNVSGRGLTRVLCASGSDPVITIAT